MDMTEVDRWFQAYDNPLKEVMQRVRTLLMASDERTEFTGANAEVSLEPGGAFSIHGGVIIGRNLELVPNERIVQSWRFGNWNEGIHSIVRFELKLEGDRTRVILDHTGVPEDHRSHLEAGWEAQYWEKLRKYLA